jgi:hypothetical protein
MVGMILGLFAVAMYQDKFLYYTVFGPCVVMLFICINLSVKKQDGVL